MKFPSPLIPGKLIKRYKRFLADIELNSGEVITAHCANSGRMTGLDTPGSRVWLSPKTGDTKLKFSFDIVEADGTLVGINTSYPNRIIGDAITAKLIPEFSAYGTVRREVKYGASSRIDFLLEGDRLPPCYVEVKNVHLKRGEHAEFPDAVSERASKHMKELAAEVAKGNRAAVLFLCQRGDADIFRVAADIDPAYNKAFLEARKAGVEMLCYRCKVSPEEITLEKAIKIAY